MTGPYAVGVDIGGTFTDCAVIDPSGRLETGKVPTTPADRSAGFFAAIEEAAGKFGVSLEDLMSAADRLVHGTTTGTNAVVSRSGARVGLLTTAGHEDMLRIMKGGGRTVGLSTEEVMNISAGGKPAPLVAPHLVVGVTERIDCDGDVVVPLVEASAKGKIAWLLEQGVEAIAVSTLWSIKNPLHEQRLRGLVEELAPGLFVTCSSELTGRLGEYERTTTCVMNAYIGPLMDAYVEAIESGAAKLGYRGTVLFSQCAGGAVSGAQARLTPIVTIQSGPVAGVMNSALLAREIDEPYLLTTDMGGTTYDVSVISEGEPLARDIAIFERFELALPILDVESVGAGGGSIAWLDGSGRLNVGPRSAGAVPGPVCAGRGGTEPTVTDADVVLGIIDPDSFLHGRVSLDRGAALRAITELGEKIGLDPYATAAGINGIVDAKMADIIRRMSEYRGFDPRRCTMLAFGGGGPVHGAAVARAARVPKMVVALPEVAPVWSAAGAANADVTHVVVESRVIDLPCPTGVIADACAVLERRVVAELHEEGFDDKTIRLYRSLRMKHKLQVYDVEVPVTIETLAGSDTDELARVFEEVYEQRFGANSGYKEGGIQITTFQVRAVGLTPTAPFTDGHARAVEVSAIRSVWWPELGGFADTAVLELSGAGGERYDGGMEGPFLVQLPDTVIVIGPNQSGYFDGMGNVVVETMPALPVKSI